MAFYFMGPICRDLEIEIQRQLENGRDLIYLVWVRHYFQHGVVSAPSNFNAYPFWVNSGILTGRFLLAMLIGCAAAWLSGGKEMIVGISLSMAWTVFMTISMGPWIIGFWPDTLIAWVVTVLLITVVVVTGAAIVRIHRLSRTRSYWRLG